MLSRQLCQGATADYDDATATGNVAIYDGNSGYSTATVKSKSANSLGLYDMSGNVWEWNFDWHPDYVDFDLIFRGDSREDKAENIRFAELYRYSPWYSDIVFGFRSSRTP